MHFQSIILFLAFNLIGAQKVQKRSFEEILLAHSNPSEFANTHVTPGLKDREWFNSAHSVKAQDPPQSLAAKSDTGVTGFLKALFTTNGDNLTKEGKESLKKALEMVSDMAKSDPSDQQIQKDLQDLMQKAIKYGVAINTISIDASPSSPPTAATSSMPFTNATVKKPASQVHALLFSLFIHFVLL